MGSIQLKDVRKAFGAVSVINGVNLNDRSFWPLYEFCAQKKLPLCLHPVAPCGGTDRLADYHMRNKVRAA